MATASSRGVTTVNRRGSTPPTAAVRATVRRTRALSVALACGSLAACAGVGPPHDTVAWVGTVIAAEYLPPAKRGNVTVMIPIQGSAGRVPLALPDPLMRDQDASYMYEIQPKGAGERTVQAFSRTSFAMGACVAILIPRDARVVSAYGLDAATILPSDDCR